MKNDEFTLIDIALAHSAKNPEEIGMKEISWD